MPEPRASDASTVPPPPAGGGRRLHPAAIGVWLFELIGRFIIGVIPLLFVQRSSAAIIGLAVFGLSAIGAVIRYVRFTYQIEGETLVVEGGLVARWSRVVPLSRIQSVDVVQKVRHRLFGVVELRVEAIGGRQTEAALVALRPEEAEALRARLLRDRAEAPRDDLPEIPPLVRLEPKDLLLAGITGGRVAVVAVLLGYLQELLPEDVVTRFFAGLGEGREALTGLLVLVAAFLFVSLVVSVAATVLVYWGFTVRREGERLVVTRGLLERRRSAVPLGRLQAVRLDENLIRRAFGLASLTAITAGYRGDSDELRQVSMLLPIGPREAALALTTAVLRVPAADLMAGLEPAPPRAFWRRLAVAVPAGGAVGLLAAVPFSEVGAGIFLALPLALAALFGAMARSSWRALGHAIGGAFVVVRSGAFVRRTTFAPLANLQHLSMTAGPLQRSLRLGSVRLAIPRGSAEIADVGRDRAEVRFAELTSALTGSGSGPG